MSRIVKIAGIAALVVVVALATVAAVSAQSATPTPQTGNKITDLWERMHQAIAKALGITVEQYDSAVSTAQGDVLKQAVEEGLLTQEQLIPGLGNSIAQDILFRARLHPKHPIDALAAGERKQLYDAIQGVVTEAIAKGGRNDEYDLFGNPGGYQRILDQDAAGQPCPECGTPIEKMQYLGGTCYYCPHCQV